MYYCKHFPVEKIQNYIRITLMLYHGTYLRFTVFSFSHFMYSLSSTSIMSFLTGEAFRIS
jgi:hypothetical protein